jgi:hypothetical protein
MRLLSIVLGVLLLFTGAVWILQGINILPGSFMTGDLRWAGAGVVAAAIGLYLVRPRGSENDAP